MIYLIGSIVLTSYLTLAFKACERFNISIFPAIVFNYITCVITGSIVNRSFPINVGVIDTTWFRWACLMGVLFISIFNLIGITAQKNGVAVASVATKLSLIIPVVLSVYLYNESVAGWKLVGVILALLAVILTCFPDKKMQQVDQKSHKFNSITYVIPLVLFLGSGLLDALINHVQMNYVNSENNNAYLISGFLSAAIIGFTLLIIQYISKHRKFEWKHLFAGIIIGVPNYFSIWCLLHFLKQSPWETSASIPMNNMGIVLFSTLAAAVIFKEKLSLVNKMGVLLAAFAIILIAFGNSW